MAPGDPLVIDERLAPNPAFRSLDALAFDREVWFVATDESRSLVQRSALLGRAMIYRDGRVSLHTMVPSLVAERALRFGAAEARATTMGDYRVDGIDGLVLVVHVTADAPPLILPTSPPAAVDPARQVLGEQDVAGVAFGTRDDDADDRLVARFGPPNRRGDWQDGCGGQYRWLWWGGLVVEFRRDGPSGDGWLAAYRYGRLEPRTDGADADVASADELATRHGIVLGTTVAELRAINGNGNFHTDYEGSYAARRWNVPGAQIVATIDRDFLLPEACVMQISAPREAELTVC